MTLVGFLLVFMALFISDVFWVKCVKSVTREDVFWSGVWAVGIFLPTALGTVAYVYNPWLLIPACLGHFCGTCATVWVEKYNRELILEKLINKYDWSRHSQPEFW